MYEKTLILSLYLFYNKNKLLKINNKCIFDIYFGFLKHQNYICHNIYLTLKSLCSYILLNNEKIKNTN